MRILAVMGLAALVAVACEDDWTEALDASDARPPSDAGAGDAAPDTQPCLDDFADGGRPADVANNADIAGVAPSPSATPFLRFVLQQGASAPTSYFCHHPHQQPQSPPHGTAFSAGRARFTCYVGLIDDPSRVIVNLEFPADKGVHVTGDGASVVTTLFVGFSQNYYAVAEEDCRLRQYELRVTTWEPATRRIVGDGWAMWKGGETLSPAKLRFDFDTVLAAP